MPSASLTIDRLFDLSNVPPPRIISEEETRVITHDLQEFAEYTIWRNTFAGQWEEAAQLIDVASRNTFFYQNFSWQGQKKSQQQVDASGMIALERFVAIAQSLVTPKGQLWHGLRVPPSERRYLLKDRRVKLWYEETTQRLFDFRYAANANFDAQNSANWRSLGAYGNATMYVDAYDPGYGRPFGLRYKAVPLGETFYGENHQGKIDRCVRWYRRTAYQAAQEFGVDRLPVNLLPALAKGSMWPFNFLHVVKPRNDYDPEALDHRALPFVSRYISVEGRCLMAPERGYRTFPYAPSRYAQAPLETYGRGPAQLVLPALKTLNAQKTVFLTQGHRAASPVYLLTDDGIVGFSSRPGAMNPGGMSADGKRLVDILPTGDIQITKEMLAEERAIIDDMFLVSLFKVLSEHPNMTATQVIELVNEKGMLVAPTLGRQHTEYVGAMVERELDLLANMRALDPMPPLLREAREHYEVEDTSPLALARRAGQAAGFLRLIEQLREMVAITGDPSLLDPIDFDTAIPELAIIGSVPIRWMADDRQIAAKRQARAKQQQQKAQIDALPALAAMKKADAVAQKSGLPSPQQMQAVQPGMTLQ